MNYEFLLDRPETEVDIRAAEKVLQGPSAPTTPGDSRLSSK
jgi:hypothetical protein